MPKTLTLALAQIDPTVGDIAGNVRRVLDAREQAKGADLLVLPELCLSGYPPEDLVLKDSFLRQIAEAAHELAAATRDGGPALLVGAPWKDGTQRYNAALLLDRGRIASVILKHHLPNYGVFDEARVFAPGPLPAVTPFRGTASAS
jgi:NAD+ synthase